MNEFLFFFRSAIDEDIDKIKLVREVRDKSSCIVSLQSQVKGLEKKLSALSVQNAHLLEEIERMNNTVKEVMAW